ncbi:MAG: CrcB protein [Rhodothermales bacterium]|jgi:CrcB protein
MAIKLLAVALGGAVGSVCRYLISLSAKRSLSEGQFPLGTFMANSVGCLLIGFVAGVLMAKGERPIVHVLVVTGFLGGFTTFSSFGLETFTLLQHGHTRMAALNMGSQLVVGLIAVAAGWGASRLVAG